MLFRACNIEKAGVVCQEPVPGIFEDTTCTLHIQLPPQRNYAQKKYESDSDDDKKPETNPALILKTEEPSSSCTNDPLKVEPKVEVDETPITAVDGDDTNVTICHDSNEQKSAAVETTQELNAEPMEH